MPNTQTKPRRSPISPFGSPSHAKAAVPDDVKAKIAAFNKQFGNHGDEHVQVLSQNPVWSLADIVGQAGADAIERAGSISFHSVGDTGFDSFPLNQRTGETRFDQVNKQFATAQEALISAMTSDTGERIEVGPAFLFHLGDVNYFDNTRSGYAQQFFEPFANYPRKIIAIPGNHDVEVAISQQKFACQAFIENFCGAAVPPAAAGVSPVREMAPQPGLYWRLDTPFVQIIGLCTNVGEGGGVLRSQAAGEDQYDWFKRTLKEVKAGQDQDGAKRRALIIGLHHPPFTNGNHASSPQMNQDLDDAFSEAGVWPDLVLAAHDHDYQRFTRTVELPGGSTVDIPYIVAGGGGRYHSQFGGGGGGPMDPVPGVNQEASEKGNGYLIVTAAPFRVEIAYVAIDHANQNSNEAISVDLRTRRITKR
ncbi:MAG: metallophosphoesterase [Armatimonadetes bacterium]|nr:metallophosphoesterase [Armatimonadota bacterium]